jgi:hypothetical protein
MSTFHAERSARGCRSNVARFDLGQCLWSRAQIRPPPLDFHQCLGVPAFGFSGVAGLQTLLLLAACRRVSISRLALAYEAGKRHYWDVSRDESLQETCVPPVRTKRVASSY